MGLISSSEGQYFKQLDGFRFLAIFSVMIAHFTPCNIVNRFPLGYGVLFFFVLSSFLITRILIISNRINKTRKYFSLRQFYIRRFLRIFPIYYLTVIILYFYNLHPVREVINYLLTYTINFKIGSGFDAGSFDHLWSLAVEEQFYILFPFLILFTQEKYLLKILIIMTLVGVFGRAALFISHPDNIPFSNFNTISCLDSLGIGALLAYFTIFHEDYLVRLFKNNIFFIWVAFGFISVMVFFYSLPAQAFRANFVSVVFMRLFFNIFSFWILGYSVTLGYKGIMNKFLENQLVMYLGRISYGMYLFHHFIPTFVPIISNHFGFRLFNRSDGIYLILRSLTFMVITVICASLSWKYFEKPINGLKSRFNYIPQSDRTSRVLDV